MWAAIDAYIGLTLTPGLNRFRAGLGLPAVRRPLRRWAFSTDCVIGMFPAWFGPPQPDWPLHTHTAGFPLFDERDTRPAPPQLEAFLKAGDAPVVITRGSQWRGARWFFEAAVAHCRSLGRRGILLAPAAAVPSDLPENIAHFEFIPLSELLPRAAALVHHGGAGTTALAFAAGCPQLAVPQYDDQHDNSARMVRLGGGMQMSARAYRSSRGASGLAEVMASPRIAARCAELAAAMRAQRPMEEACRVIEDLLATLPDTSSAGSAR